MPCSAIHSRPWTSTSTPSISLRALGERAGREVVGRRVLQLAREVLRVGPDGAAADGLGDVVVGGDDDLLRRSRGSSSAARAVAVEAVAGEDRALDQRRGHLVGDVVGQLPAQRARAELAGAAVDGGRGDAGALGVEARRGAPSPTTQPAPAVGVVQGQVLEARARLAALEQRAAAARPRGRGRCPRRRRRRRRSCRPSVAAGASVVAEACIGRPGYVTSLRRMPKTVILGSRPHAHRQAGRRPVDRRRHRARRAPPSPRRSSAPTSRPTQVQHVVMGQVLQAGQGQIPSRQAQIKAGIPKEVSCETINKVCASGLRASVLLDQAIRAGDVEVGVGGGMESMSRAPYLLPEARFGYRMGDAKALDAMVHDGLTNPFSGRQMFDEATEIGDELELTRPDLDRWALRSHERAIAATDEGRLPEEIVAGDGQGPQGRHRRRGRRGRRAATRRSRALAKLPGPRRQGGLAHGRQLAGRQRRRRRARARQRRVGRGQRQGGAGRDRRPRAVGQRLRLPGHHAGRARPRRRWTRPGSRRSDIDLWEINEAFASVDAATRSGCSASTRTASTSTAAPSRSATRSAPRARASSARSCTSCAGAAAAWAARRSAPAAARATRVILKVHANGA